MEKLNTNATATFMALIDKMKGKEHLKIEHYSSLYIPLTIENIANNLETPFGLAALYSLCHYYQLNGDLMQDPEMCFAVVDKRAEKLEYWKAAIIPYSYIQANMVIYQESIIIEANRFARINKKMQREQVAFANIWMKNILLQGFLNIDN